ncbi:MAG: hypothetical protein K8S27_16770 [Candidatus Omnitrophica bacterium]|nr:hypothetical protein [Candidatus Omnitrophota bacterium]
MKNKTQPIMQAKNIYFPKRSSTDEYLENEKEYCEKMKKILPNFPEEVLLQWFYRHCRQDIDDYAWLDYPTLQFEKEKWNSGKISLSGIQKNEKVQINKAHFESGIKAKHTDDIKKHFEEQFTWPIAPILLYNPDNNMSLLNGYRLTSPYHPLDGNHRLGIFISFFENSIISKERMHFVWIAKTKNV